MSEFKLPDLGEGVHEGQIIKLHAAAGQQVKEDDPLMEVETDKAAVDIASPFTGVIEKWHVEEGQLVHVGDVMVSFSEAGQGSEVGQVSESVGQVSGSVGQVSDLSRPPAQRAGETGDGSESRPTSRQAGPPGRHKPASPATRKLARELGVDLNAVDGSGPGGRVTRADVEAAAQGRSATATTTQSRCREMRVDPAPPHDAERRATRHAPESPLPAPELPPGGDGDDAHGAVRRHPLTQARKTIAANMARAWSTIPHVTDSDDADVTELESLRKGYPAPENGHRKLTPLAFIVRAVATALRRHPEFNAHFDDETQQIVYRRYINVAVGVHTERGLVAPVIRDTDRLGVIEIADALEEIVQKARTASFAVSDTRGGTYTISNAGAFGGSRYSTPIVTPGQCAVLAVGRSRWMPWVVDGEIIPRLIMPLSHSFDHRVADGGQEIAFLQDIIGQLENPARLVL